jgi:hypothetical protein
MYAIAYTTLPNAVKGLTEKAQRKLDSEGMLQPKNKRDYRTVAEVLEQLHPKSALEFFEQYLIRLPQEKTADGKYAHPETQDVHIRMEKLREQIKE